MIKTLTVLEIKKGEKVYQFQCDSDSPLGEIHDVLCMMKFDIVSRIKEAQEKEDKLKQEKKNDSIPA